MITNEVYLFYGTTGQKGASSRTLVVREERGNEVKNQRGEEIQEIWRWLRYPRTGIIAGRMVKRKVKAGALASSGNVFADLRLSNAEEKQTKVRLAVAINRILGGQNLSQAAAARRLKINQPKISALANYRLEGFSVERLMHFLTALDRDVEITIRPKPRSRKEARILISAA